MGKYGVTDWEEVKRKMDKKYWESPLTEDQYKNFITNGFLEEEDEKQSKKEIAKKAEMILGLMEKKGFFTERQKQVLSLLFGYNGKITAKRKTNFVGSKSFSDIARIMNIKQPVVYNHFKAARTKIQKYLNMHIKTKKQTD